MEESTAKIDVTVSVSDTTILISPENTIQDCVVYYPKEHPACLIQDYRPSVIQATCNFLRVQNDECAYNALLKAIRKAATMVITEVTKGLQTSYIIKLYPPDLPEENTLLSCKLTITPEGIYLTSTLNITFLFNCLNFTQLS